MGVETIKISQTWFGSRTTGRCLDSELGPTNSTIASPLSQLLCTASGFRLIIPLLVHTSHKQFACSNVVPAIDINTGYCLMARSLKAECSIGRLCRAKQRRGVTSYVNYPGWFKCRSYPLLIHIIKKGKSGHYKVITSVGIL